MKQDKIRLVEGFLDESLSAPELEDLLLLVQEDEGFRGEFLSALRMWGVIHGAFHPDPNCERLSHVLGVAIGSRRNVGSFDSRVMRALESRRTWLNRRRAVQPGQPRSHWIAGLASAGILIALLVLAIVSPTDRPSVRERSTAHDSGSVPGRSADPEEAREATRRKALAKIDAERKRLAAAAPKPQEKPNPSREEERQKSLAQLEEKGRRIGEEKQAATERTQAPGRAEPPHSLPLPGLKAETKSIAATLERVEGDVAVISANRTRQPVSQRVDLQGGEGLSSLGSKSKAGFRFPDGTRVEVGADTEIREIFDFENSRGKRIYLSKGRIEAVVARQPADRPMVFVTPHGEAQILGTTLRLVVESGEKGSTRVEVKEGRVKLSRSDGKTVNILAGHVGIAGQELVVKPGVDLWKAPAGGMLLWLRADLGVKTSRTGVAIWVDHSGSENHATQTLAECQPILVPDAIGGRPALRFDGTLSSLQLPPGFNDFRAGLSAFIVARFTAARSVDMKILDLGSAPQTTAARSGDVSIGVGSLSPKDSLWVSLRGTQTNVKGSFYEAPVDIVQSEIECLSAVVRGTGEISLYKNGLLLGQDQVLLPTGTLRSRNFIGKTLYATSSPHFQGEIAEILLYNRGLTEQERGSVESYLEEKYRR